MTTTITELARRQIQEAKKTNKAYAASELAISNKLFTEQELRARISQFTTPLNRYRFMRELVARVKGVYRHREWPQYSSESDVEWAIKNILLHVQVVQKNEPVPEYTPEEFNSLHDETKRLVTHLRQTYSETQTHTDLKTTSHLPNHKEDSSMTGRGRPVYVLSSVEEEAIKKLTLTNIKEVAKRLGVPSTTKWTLGGAAKTNVTRTYAPLIISEAAKQGVDIFQLIEQVKEGKKGLKKVSAAKEKEVRRDASIEESKSIPIPPSTTTPAPDDDSIALIKSRALSNEDVSNDEWFRLAEIVNVNTTGWDKISSKRHDQIMKALIDQITQEAKGVIVRAPSGETGNYTLDQIQSMTPDALRAYAQFLGMKTVKWVKNTSVRVKKVIDRQVELRQQAIDEVKEELEETGKKKGGHAFDGVAIGTVDITVEDVRPIAEVVEVIEDEKCRRSRSRSRSPSKAKKPPNEILVLRIDSDLLWQMSTSILNQIRERYDLPSLATEKAQKTSKQAIIEQIMNAVPRYRAPTFTPPSELPPYARIASPYNIPTPGTPYQPIGIEKATTAVDVHFECRQEIEKLANERDLLIIQLEEERNKEAKQGEITVSIEDEEIPVFEFDLESEEIKMAEEGTGEEKTAFEPSIRLQSVLPRHIRRRRPSTSPVPQMIGEGREDIRVTPAAEVREVPSVIEAYRSIRKTPRPVMFTIQGLLQSEGDQLPIIQKLFVDEKSEFDEVSYGVQKCLGVNDMC